MHLKQVLFQTVYGLYIDGKVFYSTQFKIVSGRSTKGQEAESMCNTQPQLLTGTV